MSIRLASDVVIWLTALTLALWFQNDLDLVAMDWSAFLGLALVTVVVHITLSTSFGLYRPRLRSATVEESEQLFAIGLLTGFLIWVFGATIGLALEFSQSLYVIALLIFLVLSWALRILVRRVDARLSRGDHRTRVLLYGAGSIGEAVSTQLTAPDSPYACVGLLDDDTSKVGRRMIDFRVLGTWENLAEVAGKTRAEMVLICISSFSAKRLEEIAQTAKALELQTLVFPSFESLLQGNTNVRELRELAIEDVVGRRVFQTGIESIREYIEGKIILVTGAGGSIGSEICRQVQEFSPSRLVMLDRDESGLHSTQIELYGDGLLGNDDIVLADIRDAIALSEIFERIKPDVVFHAAALKHLPLLESYPKEAWKTNVLGTLNVLRAAESVGTAIFVNISTDKAANPTSILGRTKRLTESLTSWFALQTTKRFISVRFGNVLGSRGSLIPTVQQLIERGRPVTVTNPDATRYFMTISEASQLVLEAGAIGTGGQTLVFDMGEPVKVLDIVKKMIELSGKNIPVRFGELREGEKLHEDLFSGDEDSQVSAIQPLISVAKVEPVSPAEIEMQSPS